MAKPHTIRLRGPWNVSEEGAPAKRVKLPTTWTDGLGRHLTRATLQRRFQRASIRQEFDRTYLCVNSPHAVQTVTLNDAPIPLATGRCEITDKLLDANLLAVELQRQADAVGESMLDAWLEIEQREGRP